MRARPTGRVRFYAVDEMDTHDAEVVQARIRRRVLRAFVRRGILDKDDRRDMEQWNHGGGFSLDATVRIATNDRHGLERLLRYCARPAFANERIEELDQHRLIYHLPKPGPDGRSQLILSPLELIERLAALVPPPRQHRHRYYGVLAPNAPLRAAVTALAPEAVAAQPTPVQTSDEAPHRCAARYLRAMLLARIYEAFPLTCPTCGAQMRIVAFITEAPTVRRILDCPSASPLCRHGSPQREDLRHGSKTTPDTSHMVNAHIG